MDLIFPQFVYKCSSISIWRPNAIAYKIDVISIIDRLIRQEFAFGEILLNVFIHGLKPSAWLCAEYFYSGQHAWFLTILLL